ncbi:hypothetical protein AMECASPLE_010467 [Ameca splendens]|uniref:Uncharacterized protein n=1 Tax=Ameca splendens TaxID=208324 RepID=A0ABV0YZ31_9TELE
MVLAGRINSEICQKMLDKNLSFRPFSIPASSIKTGAYLHPGKVSSPSQGHTGQTTMHTPKGNLERQINQIGHVFGLWEETRVPGENPCMQGENMQTQCRKTPGQELNLEPSCCKTTVLPTVQPKTLDKNLEIKLVGIFRQDNFKHIAKETQSPT